MRSAATPASLAAAARTPSKLLGFQQGEVAVEQRWARGGRVVRVAVAYALVPAFWVVLWLADYPRWRIAGLFAVSVVLTVIQLGRVRTRCGSFLERHASAPVAIALLALSGGLHSPLLPAAMTLPVWLLLDRGWSRAAGLQLAEFMGAILLLVWAPQAWVGPILPAPIYRTWVAVQIVINVGFLAERLVFMARTVEDAATEMLRARDESAMRALARACEVELVASKMSHELKNPLGAIKALVQVTGREASDPRTRERLELVESEVERMGHLVQQCLSGARPLESPRQEDAALGRLADDVLEVLHARALAARVSLARIGDARAYADRRLVRHALLNLVSNAVEACPDGGRVAVEIEAVGDVARVTVRDTGRGMDADTLARMGTPFFTTRGDGTGLGVLMARHIAHQHGGRLGYESAPGRGTAAVLVLPARPGAIPALAEPAAPRPPRAEQAPARTG